MARLDLVGELPDHRVDLVAAGDVQLPHQQVHRLDQAGALEQLRVVAVRPGREDQRRPLVALEQHAALVVGGEVGRARPSGRSPARAATARRGRAAPRRPPGPRSHSKKPNQPQLLSWKRWKLSSTCAVMRPTGRPSRSARKYSARPCSKNGFLRRSRNWLALEEQRRDPVRLVAVEPEREPDEATEVARRMHRPDLERPHGGGQASMPTAIDVFSKVRGHERAEQLRAAREADLLPYFRTLESAAAPGRRDGGRRAHHARLQQLPRADRRPARHRRARATRSSATARASPARACSTGRSTCTSSSSARSPSGWAPRRRSSSPPGHQANVGTLGTILAPGDTVIADSGDHASILDGCLLSRAKLRPFRHNRLDKLEKMLERAARRRRRRARRRRRRLLDGGRRRPAAADRRALPRARRAADGRRGARRRRARRARRRHGRAVRRRGPRRPAHGHVLEVAGVLRRLHRRLARGDRLPAHPRRARSCSPPPAVPAAVGAALAALRVIRSEDGPPLFARVLENAAYLNRGLRELGFQVVEPQPLPDGSTVIDADRPGRRRRRLEGRAAVARALRRGRLRQRRAAPGGPARRARCCARA